MAVASILDERAWVAPASARTAPVRPRLCFAAALVVVPVTLLAAVTTLTATVMVLTGL